MTADDGCDPGWRAPTPPPNDPNCPGGVTQFRNSGVRLSGRVKEQEDPKIKDRDDEVAGLALIRATRCVYMERQKKNGFINDTEQLKPTNDMQGKEKTWHGM